MHPFSGTHLLNGCWSHFLPFFGFSPVIHTKHSLVINIPRQLLYYFGHEGEVYHGWKCLQSLFEQYCILHVALCVQLATLCGSKLSQNMGFFNKKPFERPILFVPQRGAIDRGAMILLSGWGGGALAWGGHWHGGGGGGIGMGGPLAWGGMPFSGGSPSNISTKGRVCSSRSGSGAAGLTDT